MRDHVVLCLLVLGLGCTSVGPRPLGPLREVTVVTEHWPLVDSVVIGMLGQPVMTPQPEPEFKLRVGDPAKFETYSRFRIVLLIGTPGDSIVRLVLGAKADSLATETGNLLRVANPWVRSQFALLFLCRDAGRLAPGLLVFAARVRQTLREIVLEQMTRAAYVEGADKRLTEEMGEKYAFSIDVPKRWRVNEDRAESGFIYLYVHYPDRSVFVHWEDSVRALVPAELAALRDRLTGEYYNGDSLNPEYTQAESVAFLASPAVRLSGVWQNRKDVIGGPFVTYCVNYQGRFYMIDGVVFNPGKKKLDGMTQVEAVVRTFTPR
jgi:hypothetical protein